LVTAAERYMAKPLTRLQLAEVVKASRLSTLPGHLKPWLSSLSVAALSGALTLQDPAFVYLTVRSSLDVPDSAAILDVSQLGTFVAGSAALVMNLGLIAASTTAGKALASLLFSPLRPDLIKAAPEDEALVRSAHKLNFARRGAVLAICGATTGWLTYLLHGFAEARFAGSAFAAGSSPLTGTLVLMITSLPGMIVLLEAVACAPAFVHQRAVDRWNLNFRLREFFSIRAERWLQRALRRAHAAASQAVNRLLDVRAGVQLSSAAEVAEAAIEGGHKDLVAECDSDAPESFMAPTTPLTRQVESVIEHWEARTALQHPQHPKLSELWKRFWAASPEAPAEGAQGESAPRHRASAPPTAENPA
jgi:hypothetical protein